MLHLLDIPEYNVRAFQPIGGRMPLFGKSDPPPPPDYAAAAQATAQGNLEATRAAVKANRINQYTPYGKLTYKQNPKGQPDYAAYNKAVELYNASNSGGYQSSDAAPPRFGFGGFVDNDNDSESSIFGPDSGAQTGGQNAVRSGVGPRFQGSIFGSDSGAQNGGQNAVRSGVAPRLEDFTKYDEDSGWEQTMELTPQAQQALDQQLALNIKYGETANAGFDRVRELFENPQLDTSLLPDRAINVGQTAQQAIMSRLNPQMQQREEQMRQQMANQGIGLGSTAFGREYANFNQGRNDLEMQAALQGINLDQANRSAALQEQAYLQDRPLNLINSLRTGNQVQAPQFQQFAQQQTTSGPDMMGAANAQYGAELDAYNAEQAQMGGLFGGLMKLGTAPLGGTAIGGMFGMK